MMSDNIRLELASDIRVKLFRDFYWSVNVFDSFDNDPPEGGAKNDFGISTSLGWTF